MGVKTNSLGISMEGSGVDSKWIWNSEDKWYNITNLGDMYVGTFKNGLKHGKGSELEDYVNGLP